MILAMIVRSLIGWVICSSLLAAWLGDGADVVFPAHNCASSLCHSAFAEQLALGDTEFSGPCRASTRWRLELCLLGPSNSLTPVKSKSGKLLVADANTLRYYAIPRDLLTPKMAHMGHRSHDATNSDASICDDGLLTIFSHRWPWQYA
jgi:hypothetical protein